MQGEISKTRMERGREGEYLFSPVGRKGLCMGTPRTIDGEKKGEQVPRILEGNDSVYMSHERSSPFQRYRGGDRESSL